MDCREAMVELEQCFDEDLTHSAGLDRHISKCAACRKKAAELELTERMLYALPFEAPEGIEERVLAAVNLEHSRQNRPVVIAALLVCTMTSVGLLNWLLPIQAIEDTVWRYVQRWIPDTQWLGSGRSYRDQIDMAWSTALDLSARIEWFSAATIWGSLAAAVALLVCLNSICATQFRQVDQ